MASSVALSAFSISCGAFLWWVKAVTTFETSFRGGGIFSSGTSFFPSARRLGLTNSSPLTFVPCLRRPLLNEVNVWTLLFISQVRLLIPDILVVPGHFHGLLQSK